MGHIIDIDVSRVYVFQLVECDEQLFFYYGFCVVLPSELCSLVCG